MLFILHYYLEIIKLQRESNHPPHFQDDSSVLNPSAFIPFCGFGGKSEILGSKYQNFSLPFCSSFQPIILNDEVCYEINIEERIKKIEEEDLKSGLLLLLDFNEDKQFHSLVEHEDHPADNDFFKQLASKADGEQLKIYIETIGSSGFIIGCLQKKILFLFIFTV